MIEQNNKLTVEGIDNIKHTMRMMLVAHGIPGASNEQPAIGILDRNRLIMEDFNSRDLAPEHAHYYAKYIDAIDELKTYCGKANAALNALRPETTPTEGQLADLRNFDTMAACYDEARKQLYDASMDPENNFKLAGRGRVFVSKGITKDGIEYELTPPSGDLSLIEGHFEEGYDAILRLLGDIKVKLADMGITQNHVVAAAAAQPTANVAAAQPAAGPRALRLKPETEAAFSGAIAACKTEADRTAFRHLLRHRDDRIASGIYTDEYPLKNVMETVIRSVEKGRMGALRAFEAAALDENGNPKAGLSNTGSRAENVASDYRNFLLAYITIYHDTGGILSGSNGPKAALEREGKLQPGAERDEIDRLSFRKLVADYARISSKFPQFNDSVSTIAKGDRADICIRLFPSQEGNSFVAEPNQDFSTAWWNYKVGKERALENVPEVPGYRFNTGIGEGVAAASIAQAPIVAPTVAPAQVALPGEVNYGGIYKDQNNVPDLLKVAKALVGIGKWQLQQDIERERGGNPRYAAKLDKALRIVDPENWKMELIGSPPQSVLHFIPADPEELRVVKAILAKRDINGNTPGDTLLQIENPDALTKLYALVPTLESVKPGIHRPGRAANIRASWENDDDHTFNVASFAGEVAATHDHVAMEAKIRNQRDINPEHAAKAMALLPATELLVNGSWKENTIIEQPNDNTAPPHATTPQDFVTRLLQFLRFIPAVQQYLDTWDANAPIEQPASPPKTHVAVNLVLDNPEALRKVGEIQHVLDGIIGHHTHTVVTSRSLDPKGVRVIRIEDEHAIETLRRHKIIPDAREPAARGR